MRIQIATALDDDVFDAAGHIDFGVSAIGAIAGIDPGKCVRTRGWAEGEQFLSGGSVVVIAGGRGRAAEPQETFSAIGNFVAGLIDDANFVFRQRGAGGDERDRANFRGRRRRGAPFDCKGFAFDAIDPRRAIERRHGYGEGGLREAVNGEMGFIAKAVARETRGEALHGFGVDGFGAIHGYAPGTQVEPFDVFVGYFSYAEFVGEVGCCGDGAAVFVKGPQPAFGTRQERERRHYAQWHAELQEGQPRADESHVVVERQPTDADVAWTHLYCGADGAHVCEQIGVREHDAFGIARGTGGVLQESDIAGTAVAAADQVRRHRAWRGGRGFVGGLEESFRVDDGGEGRHARLQQVCDGFGAAEGQQEANFRVVENGGLASGVFFDAVRAERRIDRYRNRAGEKNACVGDEERAGGWQHQRDAATGGDATAPKLEGATLSGGVKLAKGEGEVAFFSGGVFFGDEQVRAVGIMLGAIAQ